MSVLCHIIFMNVMLNLFKHLIRIGNQYVIKKPLK